MMSTTFVSFHGMALAVSIGVLAFAEALTVHVDHFFRILSLGVGMAVDGIVIKFPYHRP